VIAPIWYQKLSPETWSEINTLLEIENDVLKLDFNRSEIETVISLPWISGFIEAEGSFYIVRKDEKTNRHCHAFGLTQTGNGLVMQAIRAYFKIIAKVKSRKPKSFQLSRKKNTPLLSKKGVARFNKKRDFAPQEFYSLETTNWRSVQLVRNVLFGNLLGIKSQEFRIWERTMKHRTDWIKLQEIQRLLRKIRGCNEST